MKLITSLDRIAIFGARGMAGSAIKRSLLRSGYQNLLTPSRHDLDLLNLSEVQDWFLDNKPSVVILAAAKVGGIYANDIYPADFLLENLKIQTNVIETSWRLGVRRLLFLGSSCIYPKFTEQPLKEESLLTGSLEPTNQWYAVAKIAGIKLCESLRKQFGFDAISLMPTNLYGLGDNYHAENSHVLPGLIRRFHHAVITRAPSVTCWGTGSPLRELMHVDDLADASVFVLENWKPKSDEIPYINVGTGIDNSISELAQIISKIFEYDGEILWDKTKPDGAPKKQLDVKKICGLGWKPKILLEEGLEVTIKQYKKEYYNNTLRAQ